MKRAVFIGSVIALIFLLGRVLLPSLMMFDFHDMTNLGRVQEFTFNLTHGQFPPRLAPHFSFGMGYPVFNFYAPFSYWITSALHLSGFVIPNALKISFLLSLVTAFTAMFFWLRKYFNYYPALIGAALYASSPYFAVEIFIRGNIGEAWFLALLPLALYLLKKNSEQLTPRIFALTALGLSFIFTVHNVFSPVALGITTVYALLLTQKKRNIIALICGLLASAYFILPLVFETHLTYASSVAKLTEYQQHFLCVDQLWTTWFWGYGASVPGCIGDGLSFMLGKMQILAAVGGIVLFIKSLALKKEKLANKNNATMLAVLILGIGATFLTLYQSAFIWKIFEAILALFQFPWRFLVISIFSCAFLGAYFFDKIKLPFKTAGMIFLIFFILFYNRKFFTRHQTSIEQNVVLFLSPNYIYATLAHQIPEYFPRVGDYDYWKNFDWHGLDDKPITLTKAMPIFIRLNDPYKKIIEIPRKATFVINIHYFPYWKISLNNKPYLPKNFDKLARPIVSIKQKTTVKIEYKQTPIEQTGNIISLLTLFGLLTYTLVKPHGKPTRKTRT